MKARRMLLLAAALLATVPGSPRPVASEDIRAVVELFTSQGCSSCPPADELLAELAGRPGVLALSEHVDYWDYLGWKDPLAGRATTERQRAYARRFALRYVYTPQVVINGEAQLAGTDRAGILARIGGGGGPLPVAVTIDGGTAGSLTASVAAPSRQAQRVDADVWLFVIEGRVRTAVARGENRGHTLDNVNVVREVRHLGAWRGGNESFAFAPPDRPGVACAVLVQATEGGAILAAARRETCSN